MPGTCRGLISAGWAIKFEENRRNEEKRRKDKIMDE